MLGNVFEAGKVAFCDSCSRHDSDKSCFVCFASMIIISIVSSCHIETAPPNLNLSNVCNFSQCGCIGWKSDSRTLPPLQSICCYSTHARDYGALICLKALNFALIFYEWSQIPWSSRYTPTAVCSVGVTAPLPRCQLLVRAFEIFMEVWKESSCLSSVL